MISWPNIRPMTPAVRWWTTLILGIAIGGAIVLGIDYLRDLRDI